MKISAVNGTKNSISHQFKSILSNIPVFKSRVVHENSVTPLTSTERDYIDKFEDGKVSDARFLGEGVASKAYYSPVCDFVLKQNKYNPYIKKKSRYDMGSLAYENDILQKIDPSVESTQRAKAYVETEKGGKFLISTFVNGKPADKRGNPFTREHIDNLLKNLFRLDKSFIIHSDLSRPNLLLDNNDNVNIIDYQWADTYDLGLKRSNFGLVNSYFPVFETPNNASMFEGAGLAGYVRPMFIDDQYIFLRRYYNNKAEYTEKNIYRIEEYNSHHNFSKLTEAYQFEKARAKAYDNMDEHILNAEVLKMNILNLHRRQFSCHDLNKIEPRNILRAIPLTIRAKECADVLADFSDGYSMDKIYYSYMRKFGEFWKQNMDNWYTGVLKWIFRLMSGEESDPARIFFPEKFDDFDNLDIVDGSYSLHVPRKFASEDMKLRGLFLDAYRFGKNSIFCRKDEAYKIIDKVFRR